MFRAPTGKPFGRNNRRRNRGHMRDMWKFEIGLPEDETLGDTVAREMEDTDISIHMIVTPSLESCPGVVGVFTIHFNQFVQNTPC